jgi:HlyD family secretion protein
MQTRTERSTNRNMNTTPKTEAASVSKIVPPPAPSADRTPTQPKNWRRIIIIAALLIAAALGGFYAWKTLQPKNVGFASGNGRIQATEIDVAAKLAGRVTDIYVQEGDFVTAGQVLAQMQIDVLEAQRDEAKAQYQRALHAVASAKAQAALRESDKAAAEAVVVQREAELDAAQRRYTRTKTLTAQEVTTAQQLDDDRASQRATEAAVKAAEAQVAAAQAAIEAARSEVVGAESAVEAGQATIARIEADIKDSTLKSTRDGRVQYEVAQVGEVLPAGGKVLNMIDLADVYMTFFLPEKEAGLVALGSDVRIILDVSPDLVIPGKVSYVASVAQFTPKTVETATERQKLMFRVKGQIEPALLRKHIKIVKTGLPGVAWVKLDPKAEWPAKLAVRLRSE